MIITYARCSSPSARKIAEQDDDIILSRSSSGDVNWGRARANTSLNSDITNSTNKRVMRTLFAENDVPMPKLYTDHEAHALAKEGKELIGRPDRHSGGRGLWRINSNDTFMNAYRGTRRKKAATHFMEFIDAPREYRVHIFKGRSIRLSEKRHGETGDTAHGNYITVRPDPEHNIRHVREAAKRAVEAVGLDFGAVDVLANNNECWVLETNASPGIGGSLPKLYADTFTKWKNGELND
jgi:glutathione synthase/RimK-type ligase-like ATP-grasp enzyme